MTRREAHLPMLRSLVLAGLIALTVAGVRQSTAATSRESATMPVDATVIGTCQVVTSPIAFGPYRGVQVDVTAALTVTCSNTTPYYVNLDNGLQSVCCWHNQMAGPNGGRLVYDLFRDAARNLSWGNTLNSDGVAGTGSGNAQALTIYARLSAGRWTAPPGAYTDTVLATVHF